MDNRVRSIEHQVGVFPWLGHEEEDPDQPDDKLLTIFPPGTGSGEESVHCSLPGNYDDAYNTYRFIYNNKTDDEELSEIAKKLQRDTQLATVVPGEHIIIFTIDRDTYYEVCEDFSSLNNWL